MCKRNVPALYHNGNYLSVGLTKPIPPLTSQFP